jgi:hypothetical protein
VRLGHVALLLAGMLGSQLLSQPRNPALRISVSTMMAVGAQSVFLSHLPVFEGTLERDDFSSSRHPALLLCLGMIFSENR